MSDHDTLLAYLVPKLTGGVEDAATEALAYILNKSASCRESLAELIGIDVGDLGRVETQVIAPDQSRPDLVWFDGDNERRVIVEAKFWAGLTENQPKAYIEQLPETEKSVLLFLVPEVRINTLWHTINIRAGGDGIQLETVGSSSRVPTAEVSGTEQRLIMVSWTRLLNGMLSVAENSEISADIIQLLGLAQRQDEEAFLPLHAEELGPAFARRIKGIVRLIEDAVVARGARQGWINISGLSTSSLGYGYGRYFRFSEADEVWRLCLDYNQWATGGETPLWLQSGGGVNLAEAIDQSRFLVNGSWIAIYLKTGVEYDDVLDDVVRQLQEIGEAVRKLSKST